KRQHTAVAGAEALLPAGQAVEVLAHAPVLPDAPRPLRPAAGEAPALDVHQQAGVAGAVDDEVEALDRLVLGIRPDPRGHGDVAEPLGPQVGLERGLVMVTAVHVRFASGSRLTGDQTPHRLDQLPFRDRLLLAGGEVFHLPLATGELVRPRDQRDLEAALLG